MLRCWATKLRVAIHVTMEQPISSEKKTGNPSQAGNRGFSSDVLLWWVCPLLTSFTLDVIPATHGSHRRTAQVSRAAGKARSLPRAATISLLWHGETPQLRQHYAIQESNDLIDQIISFICRQQGWQAQHHHTWEGGSVSDFDGILQWITDNGHGKHHGRDM